MTWVLWRWWWVVGMTHGAAGTAPFCWDRACTSRSYLGGSRRPSSSARTASMMRLVAYSMLISLVLMTKW